MIDPELLAALALKSGLLSALSLLAIGFARKRSSSEKALIATAGLAATMLLPLAVQILPRLDLVAPLWPIVPKIATGAISGIEKSGASLLAALFATPAMLLVLVMVLDVLRLQRLTRRAQPLHDPVWRQFTDRHARSLGIARRIQLRVTPELRSPVSWGVGRPVILLDPATAADAAAMETVIGHECAHVARHDWALLLLSRLARSLFWFNPLIWLLTRTHAHLLELAADDLAMRLGVAGPDYAAILVRLAKRSGMSVPALANAVLRLESPLAQRVAAALDPIRRRTPASALFAVGLAGLCLAALVPLASLTVERRPADAVARDAMRVDSPPPHPELPQLDPKAWDWAANFGRQAPGASKVVEPDVTRADRMNDT